MIQGVTIDNVYKKVGFKDYEDGSVTIEDKMAKLNRNIYTKREKVYIDNIWVDTKPLVISCESERLDLSNQNENYKSSENNIKQDGFVKKPRNN